jgi:hypothetical protein
MWIRLLTIFTPEFCQKIAHPITKRRTRQLISRLQGRSALSRPDTQRKVETLVVKFATDKE